MKDFVASSQLSDSAGHTNTADRALPPRLLVAFQAATGLGVRVVPADSETPLWACENPFCRLLRTSRVPGAPCRSMRGTRAFAATSSWFRRCPAGLEHVAFALAGPTEPSWWVESGQVFLTPPRPSDFEALCRRLALDGGHSSMSEMRRTFLAAPVLNRQKLGAGVELLRQLIPKLEPLLPLGNRAPIASVDDRIEAIRRFVERHLSEPMRLADLAGHVGLDPAYLCRLFRRRTGQTLGDLIAGLRVERAKRLLADQASRVVDVAFAAGFESVRQFNHVFKERMRQSPVEFRRSLETGR